MKIENLKITRLFIFYFCRWEIKDAVGENEGMPTIPGFHEIQIESFYRIINEGFIENYAFQKLLI